MRPDSAIQNLIKALRQHLASVADEAVVWAPADPQAPGSPMRAVDEPEHLQAEFDSCRLTVLPVAQRPGWVRFDLDLLSLGLAEVEARREALLLLHQINHATLTLHPWRVCIDDECTLILTARLDASSISCAELPAFLEEAMAQGQRVVGLWRAASVGVSVGDRTPPAFGHGRAPRSGSHAEGLIMSDFSTWLNELLAAYHPSAHSAEARWQHKGWVTADEADQIWFN